MNIYQVGHITFRTEHEWVQLMPPYYILRFTLKQEGPHGEWMEMNKSTIAIDQEGNYDITLEVRIDNFSAIHLYQKFGFKSVSIRKNYYNGIDGILMERKFEGD